MKEAQRAVSHRLIGESDGTLPSQERGSLHCSNDMHQPGIEPGSVPWQETILPLDHWCFAAYTC
ncbi:hypothetical protein PVK06_040921 [Gossypium arboreum]|uniref:Uncharacterized protein n=1 Tax=Gossypium arboreum TaxID=29729 RepID=A0ABR0N7L4_GOSAR|nr:hypothetical protein PVK06_040921 [Gossypium arboreum]